MPVHRSVIYLFIAAGVGWGWGGWADPPHAYKSALAVSARTGFGPIPSFTHTNVQK